MIPHGLPVERRAVLRQPEARAPGDDPGGVRAVGAEVTFADYDRFTHRDKVDDEGWGRGRRPLVNVSWNAAQDYVAWLSAQTGALPAA